MAEAVEPLNAQLAAGVKLLVATLLVKLTEPVGVMNVLGEVSVTVAVQVVGALTGTEAGLQLTSAVVVRLSMVTAAVSELVA